MMKIHSDISDPKSRLFKAKSEQGQNLPSDKLPHASHTKPLNSTQQAKSACAKTDDTSLTAYTQHNLINSDTSQKKNTHIPLLTKHLVLQRSGLLINENIFRDAF